MSKQVNTNILILGITGVGKSSFLNYLFGSKIADTGNCRPVTGNLIYKHSPFEYSGINITLYDSFGLEPDKVDLWKEKILYEAQTANSKEIKDWFHTIVYCIDAKKSRLTEEEFNSIINPLINDGNKICFVLTKCDLASDNEINGIITTLESRIKNPTICRVCSVNKTLRTGEKSDPYGKDEFYEIVIKNLSVNMYNKTLIEYNNFAQKRMESFKDELLRCYDEESGFFTFQSTTLEKVQEHMNKRLDTVHREILDKLKKDIISTNSYLEKINSSLIPNITSVHIQRRISQTPQLSFDSSEVFAHIAINCIPVLNVLYQFVASEIHKDELREKLNSFVITYMADTVAPIIKQARHALKIED